MLVSMKSLMRDAVAGKYCVGYFEAWNMDAMHAVVNAAERENSPVIIGFSGNFLGNPERIVPEQISQYGAVAVEAARNANVPVAVLLNESPRMDLLVQALSAGFNAVMYQKPGEDYEDTLRITKYLCETAHYLGADVESEVGELPTSDISSGGMTLKRVPVFVGISTVKNSFPTWERSGGRIPLRPKMRNSTSNIFSA